MLKRGSDGETGGVDDGPTTAAANCIFKASLETLAEFYPNIDQREAVDALSELNKSVCGR